jgi:hypothetical protein
MKNAISPLFLILFVVSSLTFAQKPKRGTIRLPPTVAPTQSTPAAPKPTQPAQPATSKTPAAPVPLVVVNGQTLTTEGLPAELKSQIDTVEDRIARAKRTVLDLQINTVLLETEAGKRHISSHQLYESEVTQRISPATPAQVKQFYEDNKDQFGATDLAVVTPQIEAYIHDEHETDLLMRSWPVSKNQRLW